MKKLGCNYKIGVSLYDNIELRDVLDCKNIPRVIQLPINILDTKLYRKGILSSLKIQNIEIHARSVFLQGLFYLNNNKIKNLFPDVWPFIQNLSQIADQAKLSLSELSLKWVSSLNEIDKVILGVENTSQLKEHLNTLRKEINSDVFQKATSVIYENQKILNPKNWNF